MLISIGRTAFAIISVPLSAFHRSQALRVLPHFPFSTCPSPKSLPQILKDLGFTDARIAVLAHRAPWILSSTPGDLVSTKMNYLCQEFAHDRSKLVHLVFSSPSVLRSSLKNTIIPSVDYVRAVLGSQSRLIRALTRLPWLLNSGHTTVAANIDILKNHGVPASSISNLLLSKPRMLTGKCEWFCNLLDTVIAAGFNPSEPMFLHALQVRSSMSNSTWEKKVDAYACFGWSSEESQLAFKKWPFFFAYSEERIKRHLQFLTGVLGIGMPEVLSNVKLVSLSLERSLMPRCCVLNVLMGKDLVRKDMNLPCVLCKTRKSFAKQFVEKYGDSVPEVLDAYQGKIQFSGFDHKR